MYLNRSFLSDSVEDMRGSPLTSHVSRESAYLKLPPLGREMTNLLIFFSTQMKSDQYSSASFHITESTNKVFSPSFIFYHYHRTSSTFEICDSTIETLQARTFNTSLYLLVLGPSRSSPPVQCWRWISCYHSLRVSRISSNKRQILSRIDYPFNIPPIARDIRWWY